MQIKAYIYIHILHNSIKDLQHSYVFKVARILMFLITPYFYRAKLCYKKDNPERGVYESDLMGFSDNLKLSIDFETIQGCQSSICQVKLVRLGNGIITDELNYLVQTTGIIYINNLSNVKRLPTPAAIPYIFGYLKFYESPIVSPSALDHS